MDNPVLKVLLVDDEVLVREWLKQCVTWDRLGATIVGEAADAGEALDLVDQLLPDLIFTDICMPVMDGIELSEVILSKYPWMKVVIITGYEDFDYAQRSIRAGVTEYLLKPIDDTEITRVFLKLQSQILTERNRDFEYRQLKQEMQDNLPYLREKFLNELLLYPVKRERIAPKMAFYGLNFQTDLFQVMVIEIYEANQESNEEERLLLRRQGYEIIREKLGNAAALTIFMDQRQRPVIINNAACDDSASLAETAKLALLKRLHCIVYIGIGNRGSGYDRIRISYREACLALKNKVLTGQNEIISYNNERHHKKVNQVIREIEEYLQKNYADSTLSLVTVAKHFYINPSYLSRIFKQAVNQTFVEYLFRIRMEKARQLLEETDLKAYQIAGLVGIDDPHYFGICFKKYTGMSVNDYKKVLCL